MIPTTYNELAFALFFILVGIMLFFFVFAGVANLLIRIGIKREQRKDLERFGKLERVVKLEESNQRVRYCSECGAKMDLEDKEL